MRDRILNYIIAALAAVAVVLAFVIMFVPAKDKNPGSTPEPKSTPAETASDSGEVGS